MSLRVLVVEDDREIRSLLLSSLGVEGFEVQTAVTVNEASALLEHSLPDLVLLDLGLPDGDGAELVGRIRRKHGLPILVISARHQEAEKVELLDAGADDYLTKPFSVSELLARIRVSLRHRGTALARAQLLHEFEDLRVDLEARLVTAKGAEVHLTPTEFDLAGPARTQRRQSGHPPAVADGCLGCRVHGPHPLSAPLHGPAPGEARAGPGRTAVPAERNRGGLPSGRRLATGRRRPTASLNHAAPIEIAESGEAQNSALRPDYWLPTHLPVPRSSSRSARNGIRGGGAGDCDDRGIKAAWSIFA